MRLDEPAPPSPPPPPLPPAEARRRRYKLTIAYRGTAYHGWQAQEASPTWKGERPEEGRGLPTIQETVARAIEAVVRHAVRLVGSSRTDAGVHAKGQVAHFDTTALTIPPERLRKATNARLPQDVVVRAIEAVPPTFDAIGSTLSKRYQYLIWNAPERPVMLAGLAWHRWQALDVGAMREAAALLVGEHDFASFARPGHGRENTVRRVLSADVSRRGPRVVIGIEGTGFLWNMVRIVVGTLVEVGIGRVEPGRVAEMLEARDRRAAGPTAPAEGLYLQWIRYRDAAELEGSPPPLPSPARGEGDAVASVRVMHSAYWKGAVEVARACAGELPEGAAGRVWRDLHFQNGYAATVSGRVVGFVLFNVEGDEARLTWLAVEPAWRRKGIGRRLVEKVAGQVRGAGVARLAARRGAGEAFFGRLGMGAEEGWVVKGL